MIRRPSTLLAVVVVAAAALLSACVPSAPQSNSSWKPFPTVVPTFAPTTTAPTSSTTASTSTTSTTSTTTPPTPRELCEQDLQDFVDEANAGTYTSPAYSVDLTLSGTTAIDNPADTGQPSTGAASVTIGFAAYDADGNAILPTASQPLYINLYGGGTAFSTTESSRIGTSSDPMTFEVTGGSQITVAYDGTFLAAPPTVQAALQLGHVNGCTGTASSSIGAITIPFRNRMEEQGTEAVDLPARCAGCTPADVVADGIRLRAAVGYAEGWPTAPTAPPATSPGSGDLADYTVDTGSIGAAVPVDELGPNAIGPSGPGYKFYDSSGYEYMGFLYLAPVSVEDAHGDAVASIPIRVLGVELGGCHPGSQFPCNAQSNPIPNPDAFHYMGVGFDRSSGSAADPLVSPADNPLLQLQPSAGQRFAPGYVLDASGVHVGLDPVQTSGYLEVPLTQSTTVGGDWLTAQATIGVGASSAPATALVDTGITEMYLDAGAGVNFPARIPTTDPVSIKFGLQSQSPMPLDYSFSVDSTENPPQTGMNPSKVVRVGQAPPNTVFVNTGRFVLYEQQVMFRSGYGSLGFKALSTSLRP